MQFDVFISFDGNCREAVEFYAEVFKSEVKNMMTYEQAPPDPNYTVPESDKEKVMYVDVQIGNLTAMFMDMPSGMPLVKGNNISEESLYLAQGKLREESFPRKVVV